MLPIPGEQFSNPALRDVGDASEDVGQPCLRIDVVELGRHDQRGHGRCSVGAAFGAGIHSVDRHLFGRSGRQGDPGECQAMISLDDELMRSVFGGLLDRLQIASERLPGWLGRMLFGWALRSTVRRHSAIRKRLLHSDESLHDLLAFSGRGE